MFRAAAERAIFGAGPVDHRMGGDRAGAAPAGKAVDLQPVRGQVQLAAGQVGHRRLAPARPEGGVAQRSVKKVIHGFRLVAGENAPVEVQRARQPDVLHPQPLCVRQGVDQIIVDGKVSGG